ncbi:MAG: serine hydrolase domain-containing protein [Bacteroidota bacterium]
MKNSLRIALFLSLSFQLALGQNKVHKIDSLISSLYQNGEFSGNILVAEKGEIIYKNCLGWANEETKHKLHLNSVFELASVSKQFTALAIMILKEKGKLDLDDKIDKFIPELSYYGKISIRNLLQHTIGLPDYEKLIDSLLDKRKVATNAAVVSIFARHHPKVSFEPNSTYQYCNTGYALLATIIERISGMTYQTFMKTNVFAPLGMTSTFIANVGFNPLTINHYTYGYKKDSLSKSVSRVDHTDQYQAVVGQAHTKSTVVDLFKWDRALNTTQLVSRRSLDEIFTNGILESGMEINYGLGWWLPITDHWKDFGKMASHTGGLPGYGSKITRFSLYDRTIILLVNHEDIDISRIHNAIRDLLFDKPAPPH